MRRDGYRGGFQRDRKKGVEAPRRGGESAAPRVGGGAAASSNFVQDSGEHRPCSRRRRIHPSSGDIDTQHSHIRSGGGGGGISRRRRHARLAVASRAVYVTSVIGDCGVRLREKSMCWSNKASPLRGGGGGERSEPRLSQHGYRRHSAPRQFQARSLNEGVGGGVSEAQSSCQTRQGWLARTGD